MTTPTKQYAAKLLDTLRELDYQTVSAYYDMGNIIASIRHGKLYDALGYDTLPELVEEELSFSYASASTYAAMFNHFKRLHYNKHESVGILKDFGLTHMCQILPSMKDKLGVRAIKNRIEALDQNQINFTLTNAELDECHRALKRMGATMTDAGRYLNSSSALMHMIRAVNKRPALKAVS